MFYLSIYWIIKIQRKNIEIYLDAIKNTKYYSF